MKNLTKLSTLLLTLTTVFALSACDGEAENVGEEVDSAVTKAGNAIEDACEEVKEGVKAEDQDC
ncbi:hypothetical protein L0668_06930 [Paraglaciecola aquimarina]|uniref:YtxH domain-containing protein n=1 Tax=Paraglaciecola algarum TaxID=3050085 RepID=A0ABS9D4G8_9ALTE|nr:hypothetical protein [Paraglaciecola sp. G1-23]MCF2947833.1 hypothetical protein [Paraglaciecola sp. G1-23]